MTNTWFSDTVKNANERLFHDTELERMMLFWGEMPSRIKAVDELERAEGELLPKLLSEMSVSQSAVHTKRLIQDLLEGLRPLALSMLVDELEIFRQRWIKHLVQVIEATGLDPVYVHNIYQLINDNLIRSLSRSSRDLIRPGLEELMEILTRLDGNQKTIG